MEYDDKSRWLLLQRDDVARPRNSEPVILTLEQAADWVIKKNPIPWIGSIFSVPAPSSFPSGIAISRLLFDLLYPANGEPEAGRDDIFWNKFLPAWPLERLFDLCEILDVPAKQQLLQWFANQEGAREPNTLHYAIVDYCCKNSVHECVTTNWDFLLERAFHRRGLKTSSSGVDQGLHLPEPLMADAHIYHPHGSFSQKDIVCSLFTESRGVPIAPSLTPRAFLLLGYSGYEPSMYPHLETIGAKDALWCVRSEQDLHIPAKRRLLSLSNTVTYVGDLRELLKALGHLDASVDLKSPELSIDLSIHPNQRAVTADFLRATLGVCNLEEAFNSVGKARNKTEFFLRSSLFSEHIGALVRERSTDPLLEQVIFSVIQTAPDFLRNVHIVDQFWLWEIAHTLRQSGTLSTEQAHHLNRIALRTDLHQLGVHGLRLKLQSKYYASFLIPTFADPMTEDLYVLAADVGDIALQGECAEFLGWNVLREGDSKRALALFGSAATYYYLMGLNTAGGYLLEVCDAAIKGGKPHPVALRLI